MKAIGAIALEIVCLACLLGLCWGLATAWEAVWPKAGSVEGGVLTLLDGSQVVADSKEELDRLATELQGQIQSATLATRALPTIVDTLVLFCVAVTGYVAIRNRQTLKDWFQPVLRHLWIGVVGGGIMIVAGQLAGAVIQFVTGLDPRSQMPSPFPDGFAPSVSTAFGVTVVVLAPVAEEFYFRGRLFEALIPRLGTALTVVVTAVAFAALHQPWVLLPAFIVLGLVLAGLRLWSGGILAPIVAHAINNGLMVCLFFVLN